MWVCVDRSTRVVGSSLFVVTVMIQELFPVVVATPPPLRNFEHVFGVEISLYFSPLDPLLKNMIKVEKTFGFYS